jgi:hypothetical protein
MPYPVWNSHLPYWQRKGHFDSSLLRIWEQNLTKTNPTAIIQIYQAYLGECIDMTGRRKKQAEKNLSRGKADWVGFINITLNEAQKSELLSETPTIEDILNEVADFVFEGYKITMTHDVKGGVFIVSATGMFEDMVNGGYTMSAQGRTLSVALTALLFKHYTVTATDWRKAVQLAATDEMSGIG